LDQVIELADGSNITLTGPEGPVPLQSAVTGETLNVTPETLKVGAAYTLTIGKGAIRNVLGEHSDEDQAYRFKTLIPEVKNIFVKSNAEKAPLEYTYTAEAIGGHEPEFAFFIKANGQWEVLQDYSRNPVLIWKPVLPGFYEFKVLARSAGRVNEFDQSYQFTEFVIDTVKPSLSIVPNISVPTKGNVVLQVKATDNFGIKRIKLPNGQYVNGPAASYTVTNNGVYTFEVEDVSGMFETKSISVTNIDKTGPELTLTPNTKAPTKKDVIVTVTAKDNMQVKRIILPNGKEVTGGSTKYTVAKNGTYTFAVEDTAGNKTTKSIKISNIYKTAPGAPAVNPVWDSHSAITGKATANMTVYAKVGSKTIGSAAVSAKGDYKIKIAKQKAGTAISVQVKDPAGNVSKAKSVNVLDKTPPPAPTVNSITSRSKTVTGKAEKGATVYVYNGSKYLNKGPVDSKGNYRIGIRQQKKGSTISVYALDKSKNKSKVTKIKVK